MTTEYRTVNPVNNELVREFPTLDDVEAESVLQRAHTAFLGWRDVDVTERVQLYRRLAELLEKNADELARAITLEMGKLYQVSRDEITLQAKVFLEYYADLAERVLSDTPIDASSLARAYTRREPVGVILGIGPWNGPYYQALRVLAPNLILGNTVVLKPAPICAGSTLMLDELFREAGFPEGVYQTGLLSHEQVSRFIADSRVRGVSFTGSDLTGQRIAGQAAEHTKPVILELGGSDPFVVLDSADPQKAAANAAACRLNQTGQVCCGPKRLIVTEKVAGEFIAALSEQIRATVVGDPMDPQTTLGPLASVEHLEHVQSQLDDALDKGVTVLVPGGRMDGPGAFFAPAVVTDITPGMRMYGEEVFGPVVMIYRVPDADAAVALANDTKYGLGATVFADDPQEADRVARRLDVGMVGINGWLGSPVEVPFGGTKASGYGRELGGVPGLEAFSNLKTYGVA